MRNPSQQRCGPLAAAVTTRQKLINEPGDEASRKTGLSQNGICAVTQEMSLHKMFANVKLTLVACSLNNASLRLPGGAGAYLARMQPFLIGGICHG
jgi:hypothetical protein